MTQHDSTRDVWSFVWCVSEAICLSCESLQCSVKGPFQSTASFYVFFSCGMQQKATMFKSYFNRIRGKYKKFTVSNCFPKTVSNCFDSFAMGSGASAPTDEKSQSPTLGGIGIWSPSCWWCFCHVFHSNWGKDVQFFCCETPIGS